MMENNKPLHRPKEGSCAWNEHVLCSSYPPSIWQYCDDVPTRCCGCGWNPAVSAARAVKNRESGSMPRYIDADAFRQRMYHEAFETDTAMQRWDSGCWIRYKLFENCLKSMPTISPDEVRATKEVNDGKTA